jgi:hypothetical protein
MLLQQQAAGLLSAAGRALALVALSAAGCSTKLCTERWKTTSLAQDPLRLVPPRLAAPLAQCQAGLQLGSPLAVKRQKQAAVAAVSGLLLLMRQNQAAAGRKGWGPRGPAETKPQL